MLHVMTLKNEGRINLYLIFKPSPEYTLYSTNFQQVTVFGKYIL